MTDVIRTWNTCCSRLLWIEWWNVSLIFAFSKWNIFKMFLISIQIPADKYSVTAKPGQACNQTFWKRVLTCLKASTGNLIFLLRCLGFGQNSSAVHVATTDNYAFPKKINYFGILICSFDSLMNYFLLTCMQIFASIDMQHNVITHLKTS